MRSKKFKKVIEREWNDFVIIYLSNSLLFSFIGGMILLSGTIEFFPILCLSVPLWCWIPMYLVEVKRKVYWEETS